MSRAIFVIVFLFAALSSLTAFATESSVDKHRFTYSALQAGTHADATLACDQATQTLGANIETLQLRYPEYDFQNDVKIGATVNGHSAQSRTKESYSCDLNFFNHNPYYIFRVTRLETIQDERCAPTFDRFLENKSLLISYTEEKRTSIKKRYRCFADSIELVKRW